MGYFSKTAVIFNTAPWLPNLPIQHSFEFLWYVVYKTLDFAWKNKETPGHKKPLLIFILLNRSSLFSSYLGLGHGVSGVDFLPILRKLK